MSLKTTLVTLAAAGVLATSGLAMAQTAATAPAPAQRHLNLIQKHPTMSAMAVGAATHHALKMEAARDKANGRKLNFAERHPTMSALGAGMLTHHEIKKHTPPAH